MLVLCMFIPKQYVQLGEERQSGVKFLVYGNNASGEAWTLNPRIWSKVRKFLLSISSYLWHLGFVSGPVYESWSPQGGEGGTQHCTIPGVFAQTSNPLAFYIPLFREKVPLSYTCFSEMAVDVAWGFEGVLTGRKLQRWTHSKLGGRGVSETPFPAFSTRHFQ